MIQKAGSGKARELSLGYKFSERNEITKELIMTMEFSSGSCGYYCNLEKNAMLFECKEVKIPWRSN